MTISICSTDPRFRYAARVLSGRGHTVLFADPRVKSPPPCDVLLLPLPITRDGATVAGMPALTLSSCIGGSSPPRLLLGGNLSGEFVAGARRVGIAVRDYMDSGDFVLQNAALSAQAALGILLSSSPAAPGENPTAILGFGRIGKFLCRSLLSLGCPVTVFARAQIDRTLARLIGANAKDTADLASLTPYRTVVNTVPARLLSEGAVASLNPGSLLLELASGESNLPTPAPGSGVTLTVAHGLPGRVFPESAGRALGETAARLIADALPKG